MLRTVNSEVPRALRLMQRMDRLNVSARGLAELAGIDRASVTNARDGKARSGTYGALEAALDKLEHETDADTTPPVSCTITLPDGTRLTQEGDPERVAEAVVKILRDLGLSVGDVT